jgi:hypothetical protein
MADNSLAIKQYRGLAPAFIHLEVRIGGIQLIDPVYYSVEPLHFVLPSAPRALNICIE